MQEKQKWNTDSEDLFVNLNAKPLNYKYFDFTIADLITRLETKEMIIPNSGNDDKQNISNSEILTNFQRNLVWTQKQKDSFIDSILLEYPTPSIFLVKSLSGKYIVLDGQQRLSTLLEYKKNKFLLKNCNKNFMGLSFEKLSEYEKRIFNNAFLHAIIVDDVKNQKSIFDLFQRLNAGGTKLSSHEIRFAIYSTNDIIKKITSINKKENWRLLYGPINHKLKDHELILRIFALYNNWERYEDPLKFFLNNYLDTNKTLSDIEVEKFYKVCEFINRNKMKNEFFVRHKNVNHSFLETIFVSLMKNIKIVDENNNIFVKNAIKVLIENKEFFDTIWGRSSIFSTQNVKTRIRLCINELSK